MLSIMACVDLFVFAPCKYTPLQPRNTWHMYLVLSVRTAARHTRKDEVSLRAVRDGEQALWVAVLLQVLRPRMVAVAAELVRVGPTPWLGSNQWRRRCVTWDGSAADLGSAQPSGPPSPAQQRGPPNCQGGGKSLALKCTFFRPIPDFCTAHCHGPPGIQPHRKWFDPPPPM